MSVTGAPSLLDPDRELRAVRHRETSPLLEFSGHRAISDDHSGAVVIHVEQFGRQSETTVVSLALFGIHGDSHARTLDRASRHISLRSPHGPRTSVAVHRTSTSRGR